MVMRWVTHFPISDCQPRQNTPSLASLPEVNAYLPGPVRCTGRHKTGRHRGDPMSVPKPLVRTRLRMARSLMHSPRVSLGAKRTTADAVVGGADAPEGAIYDFDVIAGLPVQFVTVEGAGPAADRATMIYLHGGGHVVGSAKAYRAFAANLALHAGMDVILPEYPLAPENPYPAALDSLVALYRALPDYGVDPATVVLAGDDAGAGLALSLALEVRDQGLPMPSAIGMISPWLDLHADV